MKHKLTSKFKYILFILFTTLCFIGNTDKTYAANGDVILHNNVDDGFGIYYYDNTDDSALVYTTNASVATNGTHFSTVGWQMTIGDKTVIILTSDKDTIKTFKNKANNKTFRRGVSQIKASDFGADSFIDLSVTNAKKGDLYERYDRIPGKIKYSLDMAEIPLSPYIVINGKELKTLEELYYFKYSTGVTIKMNAIVNFYVNQTQLKATRYDLDTANAYCNSHGYRSNFSGNYKGYFNNTVNTSVDKVGIKTSWADGVPQGVKDKNNVNLNGNGVKNKENVFEAAYIETNGGLCKTNGTTSNTTTLLQIGKIGVDSSGAGILGKYDHKRGANPTYKVEDSTIKSQNIPASPNIIRKAVNIISPTGHLKLKAGFHIVNCENMFGGRINTTANVSTSDRYGSLSSGQRNTTANVFRIYNGRASNVRLLNERSLTTGNYYETTYTIAPNGYFIEYKKTKKQKVGAYVYGMAYDWTDYSQRIEGYERFNVDSLLGDGKNILEQQHIPNDSAGYYVTDWKVGTDSLKKDDGIKNLTPVPNKLLKANPTIEPKEIKVRYHRYNSETETWSVSEAETDTFQTDLSNGIRTLKNTNGNGVANYWTTVVNPADPNAAEPGLEYKGVKLDGGYVFDLKHILEWTKDARVSKLNANVLSMPVMLDLYEVPLEYYAFSYNTSYTVRNYDNTQVYSFVNNEGKLSELRDGQKGITATSDSIAFGANNDVFAWSVNADSTIEQVTANSVKHYLPGTEFDMTDLKNSTTPIKINGKKVYVLYAVPGYCTQYNVNYYVNTTSDKTSFKTEDTGKLTQGTYTIKDVGAISEFRDKVTYVEDGKLVNAEEVGISNKNIFKELKGTTVYSDGSHLYKFFGWSADHDTVSSVDTNSLIYKAHYKAGHSLGGSSDLNVLKSANEPLTDTICYDNVIAPALNVYSSPLSRASKLLDNRVAPPVNTSCIDAKLFAIWDEYPTITQTATPTIEVTEDAMSSEQKFFEKLYSIISVTDKEDGTITPTITNIDYNEVKQIAESLSSQQIERISFLVTAVDSLGNTSYYNAKVALKNNSTDRDTYMTTLNEYIQRFINEYYYSLGDSNSSNYAANYSEDNYHSYGGLNPKSKWYLDEDYRNTILDAFDRVENRKEPEEVWTFTGDTVLDAKNYIDVHGFHKWNSDDALINFYNQFKDRAKDVETFVPGEK